MEKEHKDPFLFGIALFKKRPTVVRKEMAVNTTLYHI